MSIREYHKPGIILGGAQKAASTSLFYLLAAHPRIAIYSGKEPNLFSRSEDLSDTRWLESGDALYMDGSTSYFSEEYAPERIHSVAPDAKLIFMLRDPARRALSGYMHIAKYYHDKRTCLPGLFDKSANLEDAVERELEGVHAARKEGLIVCKTYERRYDDPLWIFRHLWNSDYEKRLMGYYDLFGEKQVKIVFFEDFVANQYDTVVDLSNFLEISPLAKEVLPYAHYNSSRMYKTKSAKLSRVYRELFRYAGKIPYLRAPFSRLEKKLFFDKAALLKEHLPSLTNMFAPSMKTLSELIGEDAAKRWGDR